MAIPETLDLYFDGVKKTCTLTHDPKAQHKEHLYVAEDGRFVKFPADVDLDEVVKQHNDANSAEVEIIHEDENGNVLGSSIPAQEQ